MATLNRRGSSVGGAKGVAGWGAGPAAGAYFVMTFGPVDIDANTSADTEWYEWTVPFDCTIVQAQMYCRTRGVDAKDVKVALEDAGTDFATNTGETLGTDGAVVTATLTNTDGHDLDEGDAMTIDVQNDDLTTAASEVTVTMVGYIRKHPSETEVGLAPFD